MRLNIFDLKIFPCVCVCVCVCVFVCVGTLRVCTRACVCLLHNIYETLNNTKIFTIYVSTMIKVYPSIISCIVFV